VAQTDGEPLPEPADAGGDPGATTDRLKAVIASHGIAVDYVQELDGALGTSSGGRIQVLTGLQPASEFMVLAHEFARLCPETAYVSLLLSSRKRVWLLPVTAEHNFWHGPQTETR
jgi:hypothetical protein